MKYKLTLSGNTLNFAKSPTTEGSTDRLAGTMVHDSRHRMLSKLDEVPTILKRHHASAIYPVRDWETTERHVGQRAEWKSQDQYTFARRVVVELGGARTNYTFERQHAVNKLKLIATAFSYNLFCRDCPQSKSQQTNSFNKNMSW